MSDGLIRWVYNAGNLPLFSSPSYNQGLIICASVDGSVFGVNCVDGSVAWRSAARPAAPIYSSPVADSDAHDMHIYIGTHNKTAACYASPASSSETLSMCWERAMESDVFSIPAIMPIMRNVSQTKKVLGKVVIYCSSKGLLQFLEPETGMIAGSIRIPGMVFSSPAVYGSYVVIGCRDNNVYCIEIS
jgi:acyl-CoA synthetase